MPDQKNPTPGEITIMAAGAVTLIASFLDFYKASGRLQWKRRAPGAAASSR